MNQYISKLFENVGSLVYEEAPETEKYNFMITGEQSKQGDKLECQQVLDLDSVWVITKIVIIRNIV